MKLGFYTGKSKNKAKDSAQLKAIARRFNKDLGGFDETEEYVGEDGSCIPVPYDVDPENIIDAEEDVNSPKIVSIRQHTPVMPMTIGRMGYTFNGGGSPGFVYHPLINGSSWSTGSGVSVYGHDIKPQDPNSVEYDICIVADGDTRQDNPQIHAGYCNVEIIRA